MCRGSGPLRASSACLFALGHSGRTHLVTMAAFSSAPGCSTHPSHFGRPLAHTFQRTLQQTAEIQIQDVKAQNLRSSFSTLWTPVFSAVTQCFCKLSGRLLLFIILSKTNLEKAPFILQCSHTSICVCSCFNFWKSSRINRTPIVCLVS